MKVLRLLVALVAALGIAVASPALAARTPRAAPVEGGATDSRDLAPLATPATPVEGSALDNNGPPTALDRLSVISVFMRADPIVKAVMLLLLAASIWSWTIIINKWLAFGTL